MSIVLLMVVNINNINTIAFLLDSKDVVIININNSYNYLLAKLRKYAIYKLLLSVY